MAVSLLLLTLREIFGSHARLIQASLQAANCHCLRISLPLRMRKIVYMTEVCTLHDEDLVVVD